MRAGQKICGGIGNRIPNIASQEGFIFDNSGWQDFQDPRKQSLVAGNNYLTCSVHDGTVWKSSGQMHKWGVLVGRGGES